jgi:hypothetical protein
MLCRQPQRLEVQLDYWSDIDHRDAGAPVAVRQALEQCSSAVKKPASVVTAVKACRQVVGDVARCDDPNADGDVWTAVLLRSSDVPRRASSVRGRPHAVLRFYHQQHHGQLPRSKHKAHCCARLRGTHGRQLARARSPQAETDAAPGGSARLE